MSAEILREAARKMRELAEAATPSPWMSTERHEDKKLGLSVSVAGNVKPANPKVNGARGTADFIASAYGWGPTEPNARHIASWHPLVALAVAKAMDDVAHAWEIADEAADGYVYDADDNHYRSEETVDGGWLAVARAYLGEA